MKARRIFFGIFSLSAAAIAAFLVFDMDKKHSVIEYGYIHNLDNFEEDEVLSDTPENLPITANISVAETLKKTPSGKVRPSNIFIPKKTFPMPEKINAIYVTGWSASSSAKMNYLLSIIEETEINAMVIDIKDYSGNISYATEDKEISKFGAEDPRIPDISFLLNALHSKNIYAIARVVVFQDPAFAESRPDLAIKNKDSEELWLDNKGLAWMDPASQEVWDYNIRIAKNALLKGFDEINFDYIRFPSDGNLNTLSFPIYDEMKTKREIMKDFFSYLRKSLEGHSNDMGIGQYLEDAFDSFDFVSPMVYPSHFASGFIGLDNPAAYPYEVVKYSMAQAQKRLLLSKRENLSKLRPWIQDFSLGYQYKQEEVSSQIRAVSETSGSSMMVTMARHEWPKRSGSSK